MDAPRIVENENREKLISSFNLIIASSGMLEKVTTIPAIFAFRAVIFQLNNSMCGAGP